MKKYTLFSSVLSLILLSFLGFNANSASAANCAAGDLFSSTTGQPCSTTVVVTCPTGDLFSSVTGQRCTAWQDNNTTLNTLFNRELTVGSKGEDVKAVQQILKDAGFLSGKVDGSFGPITKGAVIKYQTDNNITATGNVDSDTFAKIKDIPWYKMCPLINSTYGVSYPCPPIPTTPQSPVISGVSGPQSLDVNQTGTWTVTASDPSGGNLSYSVSWGDEVSVYPQIQSGTTTGQQSATFTHSYAQAGNYTPTFTVKNSNGQTTQTSLSVSVGNVTPPCCKPPVSSITVLSPNGGETWTKGTTQTIKWQDNRIMPTCAINSAGTSPTCVNPAPILYDIKLVTYYSPCTGQPCPAYAYHEPYPIANSVSANSYSWHVGEIAGLYDALASDGAYTVQICLSGTNVCDSSDSYFTISK